MTKRTLSATAKSNTIVEVYVNKDFCSIPLKSFYFYIDGKKHAELNIVSKSESHSSYIYTLEIKNFKFKAGIKYEILTEQNYFIPIDISFLALTSEFEEQYRYDGKLGAIYSKKSTTFRVFTPFATRVLLLLKRKGSHREESYLMDKDSNTGVFSLNVKGDLDEASYMYSAEIFSQFINVVDPYSFSLSSNSRIGYVISKERLKQINSNSSFLEKFDDKTKAIIYECSVRDMTSLSKVENEGTYLALAKEGLKTKKGTPIGLDYIASLGVTHVQLMPVLDFQTVNDDMPRKSYNWGYDPMFFFAPEGSFSKHPNDPYDRVLNLRYLISAFHRKGIRVNLDVVYNHVYSITANSLSLLVPKYYFRHNCDYSLSNGSGCGNDFESTRYMARKLILDSLLHLIDFYDCDGFRFDLMGILDIDTINIAYEKLKEIKPNIMLYGEGWDLWTNLQGDKKASYFNSYKLPEISFFNDRFRDVVKGKSNATELQVKGYLLGDCNYIDGFKHVLLGSATAFAFPPMLQSYRQSVNYVECHDNHTLFDKIAVACKEEELDKRIKRIKMVDMAILFSCGIPFFHQGQEVAHSKGGNGNTYNAGDALNGFDYTLVEKYPDLYSFFKEAVQLKKEFIKLAGDCYSNLPNYITFENLNNGALRVNYNLTENVYTIIFNPSNSTAFCDFGEDVYLIFNDMGNVENSKFLVRLGIIPSLSVNVYLAKKK